MWTPDYYVRLVPLPIAVRGATLPNDDGSFDVYINAALDRENQKSVLAHELQHIGRDHFYDDVIGLRELEAEADGG